MIGRPVREVTERVERGYMDLELCRVLRTVDPDKAEGLASNIGRGRHVPILDVDLPIEVRPSSTPGHFHVLIDAPMSWRAYKRLLRALARAGVIERSWARASISSGASFVRFPAGRGRHGD